MATTRWLTCIKRALALQARLRADQYLEVRYEDLVTRPEETLSRLCAFLGLAYSDRMLRFWDAPTTVEHRHYGHHANLGRPLFADSVGKWSARLSAEEQRYVLPRVASLQQRLGYMVTGDER